MPWKETNVMNEREKFVRAWQTGRYHKTVLCRQFGISRSLPQNSALSAIWY